MFSDVLVALRRTPSVERDRRRHRRQRRPADRRRLRRDGPRRRRARPQRRGAQRHPPRAESGPSGRCSSPATARCSTRGARRAARAARARALGADRARPPRHRHQRAAAHPARGARPAFGPGSCQRHVEHAERRGRGPRSSRSARWRSTSTRPRTSRRCRRRWPLARRRRAHAGHAQPAGAQHGMSRDRRGRRSRACRRSQPGDDLAALIAASAPHGAESTRPATCSSIAHKVVSKAEGRIRALADVAAERRARSSSPPSTARTPATSRSCSTSPARCCAPPAAC